MGRKFGFSFSAKRALGISAAKSRIARATGIPTTRSGRQRKIGRMLSGSSRGGGCSLALLAIAAWVVIGGCVLATGQIVSRPMLLGAMATRPAASQPVGRPLSPPPPTSAPPAATPSLPGLTERDGRIFEAFLHEINTFDSMRTSLASQDTLRLQVTGLEAAENNLEFLDSQDSRAMSFRRMALMSTVTRRRLCYDAQVDELADLILLASRQKTALTVAYKCLRAGTAIPAAIESACFTNQPATAPPLAASARQSSSPPMTSVTPAPRELPPVSTDKEVHVRGYYRKDGTYVRPHTRSRPSR